MQHTNMNYLHKHCKNYGGSEQGIAILFAVLMASALALVALGISQISYKELIFSLEARDSNLAFMAADTGIECGLYMDSVQAFVTSTSSTFSGSTYYCHNVPVNITTNSDGTFQFSLPLGTDSCAQVFVDKFAGTGTSTQVDSYGYNVAQQVGTTPQSCINTSSLKPNLVSRALRVTYPN